jgi:hypothetical protein
MEQSCARGLTVQGYKGPSNYEAPSGKSGVNQLS